jgi:hypothetical protein
MGRKPRSEEGPASATLQVRLTPLERRRLEGLQRAWRLPSLADAARLAIERAAQVVELLEDRRD